MNLLRLGYYFDSRAYLSQAEEILKNNAKVMEKAPRGYTHMLLALDFFIKGPTELAISNDSQTDQAAAFMRELNQRFIPNRIILCRNPGNENLPLLKNKHDDSARLYICRNYQCNAPLESVDDLPAQL